jgi:Putative Ig domain
MLPAGQVGVPYSAQVMASGGKLPYTWSIISGALPTGLSMCVSGLITGTPVQQTRAAFAAMGDRFQPTVQLQSLGRGVVILQ